MTLMKPALSELPSVEQLLQSAAAGDLIERYGRALTVEGLRAALEEARARLRSAPLAGVPSPSTILAEAGARLGQWTRPSLQPVINASGVILHTNLGRAPLSKATLAAMSQVSAGYSNLEFDLASGKRGSRLVHVESVLQRLLGVEAALVVNNNAAAVLLVLSALAARRRVIVPRSQLIEIGGGFRLPDVMRQSGARLVEIGTTNKVHLSDYEEALAASAALVMHVHRSNFKIVGFTEEPALEEIAAVAHRAGALVVDDLGSGALLDTARYGLAHEPTVQESLAAGADVVCFSGDKLLGGPQAGLIVGRAEVLARVKKHPLARAVRADKTCLAGITATLLHFLKGEAEREIPVWKMISMPLSEVRARAEAWAREVGAGRVSESRAAVGGGSLPGESLPSCVLELNVHSAARFLRRLRQQDPPVVARTESERVLLDPRTVLPEQEARLMAILQSLLAEEA